MEANFSELSPIALADFLASETYSVDNVYKDGCSAGGILGRAALHLLGNNDASTRKKLYLKWTRNWGGVRDRFTEVVLTRFGKLVSAERKRGKRPMNRRKEFVGENANTRSCALQNTTEKSQDEVLLEPFMVRAREQYNDVMYAKEGHGQFFCGSDFLSIFGGQSDNDLWVTDAAMDTAVDSFLNECRSSRIAYIPACESTMVMNMGCNGKYPNTSMSLKDKIIVMPYNENYNHWVLLVADAQEQTFQYKDPMGGSEEKGQDYFLKFKRFLMSRNERCEEKFNVDNWTMGTITLPSEVQTDSYNCGIYVILYIASLLGADHLQRNRFEPIAYRKILAGKVAALIGVGAQNIQNNTVKNSSSVSPINMRPSTTRTNRFEGAPEIKSTQVAPASRDLLGEVQTLQHGMIPNCGSSEVEFRMSHGSMHELNDQKINLTTSTLPQGTGTEDDTKEKDECIYVVVPHSDNSMSLMGEATPEQYKRDYNNLPADMQHCSLQTENKEYVPDDISNERVGLRNKESVMQGPCDRIGKHEDGECVRNQETDVYGRDNHVYLCGPLNSPRMCNRPGIIQEELLMFSSQVVTPTDENDSLNVAEESNSTKAMANAECEGHVEHAKLSKHVGDQSENASVGKDEEKLPSQQSDITREICNDMRLENEPRASMQVMYDCSFLDQPTSRTCYSSDDHGICNESEDDDFVRSKERKKYVDECSTPTCVENSCERGKGKSNKKLHSNKETRTNEGKLHKTTISRCGIFLGPIIVSENDWHEVTTKRVLNRKDWVTVLKELVSEKVGICPIAVKSSGNIKKDGEGNISNLTAYMYCTYEGCKRFTLKLWKEGQKMQGALFSNKDSVHHDEVKRVPQLRGIERIAVKDKLLQTNVYDYVQQVGQNTIPEVILTGSLKKLRSDETYRKARAEALKIDDLDADDDVDLLLKCRWEKELPEKERYLRRVGMPTRAEMYSADQLALLPPRKERIKVHLDATGSVVRKNVGQKDTIYYYAGVINVRNKIVPLMEMVTAQHDTASIGSFLLNFKQFVLKMKKSWPIFGGVVVDFSFALIHGTMLGLNHITLLQYLRTIYQYLHAEGKENLIKGIVCVFLCRNHFQKMCSREITRYTSKRNIKKLVLEVTGIMIRCRTDADVQTAFNTLGTLLMCERITPDCKQKCFATLARLSNRVDSHTQDEIEENETEDKPPYDPSDEFICGGKVLNDSPFYSQYRRYLDDLVEFCSQLQDCQEAIQNEYFCGEFFKKVVAGKWMSLLPLWTGILDDTGEGFSNANAENHMRTIKERVLKRKTKMKVGRFVEKCRKHTNTLTKFLLLGIEKREIPRKGKPKKGAVKEDTEHEHIEGDPDDPEVEEKWRPQKNHPGHFACRLIKKVSDGNQTTAVELSGMKPPLQSAVGNACGIKDVRRRMSTAVPRKRSEKCASTSMGVTVNDKPSSELFLRVHDDSCPKKRQRRQESHSSVEGEAQTRSSDSTLKVEKNEKGNEWEYGTSECNVHNPKAVPEVREKTEPGKEVHHGTVQSREEYEGDCLSNLMTSGKMNCVLPKSCVDSEHAKETKLNHSICSSNSRNEVVDLTELNSESTPLKKRSIGAVDVEQIRTMTKKRKSDLVESSPCNEVQLQSPNHGDSLERTSTVMFMPTYNASGVTLQSKSPQCTLDWRCVLYPLPYGEEIFWDNNIRLMDELINQLLCLCDESVKVFAMSCSVVSVLFRSCTAFKKDTLVNDLKELKVNNGNTTPGKKTVVDADVEDICLIGDKPLENLSVASVVVENELEDPQDMSSADIVFFPYSDIQYGYFGVGMLDTINEVVIHLNPSGNYSIVNGRVLRSIKEFILAFQFSAPTKAPRVEVDNLRLLEHESYIQCVRKSYSAGLVLHYMYCLMKGVPLQNNEIVSNFPIALLNALDSKTKISRACQLAGYSYPDFKETPICKSYRRGDGDSITHEQLEEQESAAASTLSYNVSSNTLDETTRSNDMFVYGTLSRVFLKDDFKSVLGTEPLTDGAVDFFLFALTYDVEDVCYWECETSTNILLGIGVVVNYMHQKIGEEIELLFLPYVRDSSRRCLAVVDLYTHEFMTIDPQNYCSTSDSEIFSNFKKYLDYHNSPTLMSKSFVLGQCPRYEVVHNARESSLAIVEFVKRMVQGDGNETPAEFFSRKLNFAHIKKELLRLCVRHKAKTGEDASFIQAVKNNLNLKPTTSWNGLVADVEYYRCTEKDFLVGKYGKNLIYRDDFLTLQGSKWLNNFIIDACIYCFAKEYPNNCAIMTCNEGTELYLGRTPLKFSLHPQTKLSDKVIIIPINTPQHWIVAFADTNAGDVWVMDPYIISKKTNKIVVMEIKRFLDCWNKANDNGDFVDTNKLKLLEVKEYNKQKDGYNCGVFVIKYAEDVLNGLRPSEVGRGKFDPNEYRAELASKLLECSETVKHLCLYCGGREREDTCMIMCDSCHRWIHFQPCLEYLDVTEEDVTNENYVLTCILCINHLGRKT